LIRFAMLGDVARLKSEINAIPDVSFHFIHDRSEIARALRFRSWTCRSPIWVYLKGVSKAPLVI
jgi:hypothetical protein